MNLDRLYAHFLSKLGKTGVLKNEPMSAHTTFKTGGSVDLMVQPSTNEELIFVMQALREENIPMLVIGRGSNLLISDRGIPGVVIKLADQFDRISINKNILTAKAGVPLKLLCMEAIRAELCGLEFAGGIPGCLGGAVSMNAGAYDGEIKDFLQSARVLDQNLEIKELSSNDLELSYRHSVIPEKGYIVLDASFCLDCGNPQEALTKVNEFNARRRDKQPLTYPSAGSTFKRPTGYYAGPLIEQCGLKGCSIGGAQVSEKHAGFIINTGDACSQDIYQLILHVKNTVERETGVTLETEIKLLGEFE